MDSQIIASSPESPFPPPPRSRASSSSEAPSRGARRRRPLRVILSTERSIDCTRAEEEMADLFSTIKDIVGFGLTIKSMLEKARHNVEDCRRIRGLLDVLSAIANHLHRSPKIMEDDSMTDTAEGLGKALQRASKLVAECESKGFLCRAFNADNIAEKLRGLCLDVLFNMSAVLLANSASNNSLLAELKENLAQLRADVTYTNSMLAKILQIVAAPSVHLPKEVAKLLEDYQISTQNEWEITKTDAARPEVKIQKNKKLGGSTVVPHASLPDGLAESASAPSVVGQGSSTISTNKASSSISKLVDEAQSVGVSAAPFHPQKIISIPEEPGETGRYKIISRSIENMTLVHSIDAHPTKTWIVTGHEGGTFSIWDYEKQETVMELQVNKVPGKATRKIHAWSQYFKETPPRHSVFSAKFTAEGKWLVVGDGHGYIYVYDYTDAKLHEVKKFRAHDDKSVDSLAAHPTEPYLLSSSAFGRNIEVWDWSKNWEKIQNFYVKPENAYLDGVRSVNFNPRDTDTFACVTSDDGVKVWNIKTSSLETTLKGPFVMADYLFTRSRQHLMVTLRSNSHNSEIWDLKTREVVHTLSVSGRKTTWVACHPKLPILVTMLDDGTVCLWDATTYRLEKMVHITNSKCRDLVFVPDTNGLLRLVIAFETIIAIMEVNLPIANTSNASVPVTGTN